MAFQLFGYHFEVRSTLPPEAVRSAIRSRKRGWFDFREGARGWIVGSIICLQSGTSRNGPMIMGRISRDDMGTRISGLAGYGGGLIVLGMSPGIAYIACLIYADPNPTDALPFFLILAFLIAIMSLVLWMGYKSRRDAEPLIQFLRDTVGNPDKSRKARAPIQKLAAKFSRPLSLEISGSTLDGPPTPASVRDALLEIDGDGFVILSSGDDAYLQTVQSLGRYILEKSDSGDKRLYRAVHRESEQGDHTESFTFEQALAVFLAYGSGTPMPPFLEWKPEKP